MDVLVQILLEPVQAGKQLDERRAGIGGWRVVA
jgi:hypothetical protein